MTLRLKLIGMTAGMVLFLAIVNFAQFGRVLEKQKKVAVNSTQGYAASLARSVGARFFERYQGIQALSHHETFFDLKSENVSATSVLDSFAKLYPIYDVVLLTDSKGNFLASNTRAGDGKRLNIQALKSQNYASTDWFRNASMGQLSEDAKKNYFGTFFEDVSIDAVASAAYGEDRVGTGFSTPVKNAKGETMGVLTARANIAWVLKEFELFHAYLTEHGLNSAELDLIGKQGVVLASYDSSSGSNAVTAANRNSLKLNLAEDKYEPAIELVAGHSGAGVAMHPRKQIEQAVGYVSTRNLPQFLDSMGWGILVRMDETQTYAAVTEARNQFIWVSTMVMCIFAVFSYWFAMLVGAQLAKLSENISETSAQVMAGSEQMSSASQSLASTATEAASSLEETVSSIEQLTTMVKRNADHAMEAANLSRASRESADEGEVEIKKLVEAMNEINQSSKKIEDIINVIDDIAFQTNLLALNAAVEAARAGDQGRGFAVVAEEVRNLAQRSAAAAKDITSLIKENVTKIESGVDIAGHGGNALRNIVSSVRKVADLNSEIASASKEQAHGLEQINQAMAQLDQVTQTNAASAEEVASSAEEMSSQGLMMQETVSRLNTLIHGMKTAKILAQQTAAKSQGGGFGGGGSTPNVIPMRNKTAGEKVIPFDSDKGNLGSTAGF